MRLLFCCSVLLLMFSCHKAAYKDDAKMEQLADRTCRATSMRKERFIIADQIRFAQDTLWRTKSKADSARLNARLAILLKQKTTLVNNSLKLADTIRLQLDTLMPFTDKAAQQDFTASLNKLLTQKGCNTGN